MVAFQPAMSSAPPVVFSPKPMTIKQQLKKFLPLSLLRLLYSAGSNKSFSIPSGRIRRGHFGLKPFSTSFGYDREGGPVDRYYIDSFMQTHAAAIYGQVLEIGDNEYTLAYGGDRVTQSDIFHVDASNRKATIIGDLSNAPLIPDNSFDCVILMQTLHLIYSFESAIATCHRILKPGGSLLLTSPGISPIDHGEWKSIWYWSFTEASLRTALGRYFSPDRIQMKTYGNVLTASAFLYGMGRNDLKREELDYTDPHYPVTIGAKAVKK
jgi:SAM-dependent methyltransferase